MPNENKKWKEERRRWRSSRSKGEPPNERGGEALFVFLPWSMWTSYVRRDTWRNTSGLPRNPSKGEG